MADPAEMLSLVTYGVCLLPKVLNAFVSCCVSLNPLCIPMLYFSWKALGFLSSAGLLSFQPLRGLQWVLSSGLKAFSHPKLEPKSLFYHMIFK